MVMYEKLRIGQNQEFVSRRITNNVLTHWAQSAKKTMIETATGIV